MREEEDSELLLLWHQCDHKQIKTNFKTKTRQSRANENKDAHVNMFMLWRPSAPTETRLFTTQPSSNYESTRLPFHLSVRLPFHSLATSLLLLTVRPSTQCALAAITIGTDLQRQRVTFLLLYRVYGCGAECQEHKHILYSSNWASCRSHGLQSEPVTWVILTVWRPGSCKPPRLKQLHQWKRGVFNLMERLWVMPSLNFIRPN